MNRKLFVVLTAAAVVGALSGVAHAQKVSLQDYHFSQGQDPGFRGGVNVAAGDVNGDGRADVVTGAGAGASGRIAAPGEEPQGLLLPAVQKARDAAQRAQTQNTNPPAAGPSGLSSGQEQQGLLLPAVQKVREAASR